MLRTADVTTTADLHVDQTGVTHPLQVRAHRVGVQRERFGDVGGGEWPSRSCEFEVDGVTRVVAECFEHVEIHESIVHVPRLHGLRPVKYRHGLLDNAIRPDPPA